MKFLERYVHSMCKEGQPLIVHTFCILNQPVSNAWIGSHLVIIVVVVLGNSFMNMHVASMMEPESIQKS